MTDTPEIYNALEVHVDLDGETSTLSLEVALHLGDNSVRNRLHVSIDL